jgi:hypothetical protein
MTRLPTIFALAALLVAAVAGCGGSSGSSGSTEATTEATTTGPASEREAPPVPLAPAVLQALDEASASRVPLRIPVRLLEAPPGGATQAEVLRSPPDSYTLGLSAKPDCHLRETCTTAIFSGFAGGGELTGRRVDLAKGVEGVYEPGRCGPGCSFGTVEWVQGGARYGVGIAGAPTSQVIEAANEAIVAAPVTLQRIS